MKKNESLLDSLQIASPCTANWDEMTGDERTRYCQQCQLHVHNISQMSRVEAEQFLQSKRQAKRLCVRFFRRSDGTIITDDCPVGLRTLRDAGRRTIKFVAGLLSLVFSATLTQVRAQDLKGDWAPMETGKIAAPPNYPHNGGVSFLPGDAPLPAAGPLIRPATPSLPPATDVYARVVLPETWQTDVRKATDTAVWAVNSSSLSWHVNAGMLRSAREMFAKQIKHCVAVNHRIEAAISHNNRANCFYYEGKFLQAMDEYNCALRLLEEPVFSGKAGMQTSIVANMTQAEKCSRLNDIEIKSLMSKPFVAGSGKIVWLTDRNLQMKKETKTFACN